MSLRKKEIKMIDLNREEFEKLPEIREIMNSYGIYFMNHSGWYEARDFKDFEYEQYINGAWYAWQASSQREGYKLVPVEPTIAMVRAYYETPKPTATRCYKAMIGVIG